MNNINTVNGHVLDALYQAQRQRGYVAPQDITEIASKLNLPEAQVYETSSFYAHLYLAPVGQHIIRICESAPCHVAGASKIVATLETALGISMGETTPDGRFTLEFTQCLGQCQGAPALWIDGKIITDVSPAGVYGILAALGHRQEV